MDPLNIIKKAMKFGSFHSLDNYFSFSLKCAFYIIPAIILGNFTDNSVKKMTKDKDIGENIHYYISLQTFIIISTLYIIILLSSSYASEFQVTTAGGLFIVFYFAIQTNYISMIKEYSLLRISI
jgi:hypothetical protein